MPAPKGNRFWEMRSSHGRNPTFKSAEELWGACCEYFDWNQRNPLYADKIISFKGQVTHANEKRMRAMTLGALLMFLGVTRTAWAEWKKNRQDFAVVCETAEEVIRTQKFEGASADLLNAAIIARDLGLKDSTDHTSSDGTMSPKPSFDVSKLSTTALAEIVAAANATEQSDD